MFLSVRNSGWRTADAPGKPPYHEVALTVGGPYVAASDGTLVAPTDGEWRVVLDDGPAVRDEGLRSMAVTDDGTRLWFLDRSGLLAAYDVESGTRHDVSTPADGATWEGVAVSGEAGDERGLVASGDGTVRAFTGTGNDVSWQSSASPTASGETVAVLAVAADGVGYVVDTGGNAVRTGTSGWTGMGRVNPQTTLYGIHAAAGGRVALAAADGRLYQYDPQDGSWTGRRVTNAPLRSVDRAGDRFVVGSGGSDVYVEPDGEPFWQVSHTPTSGTVRDLEADGELVVAVGGSHISQQVPGRATSGAESGSSTPAESDVADAEAREDADERGVWEPVESTGPSKVQPSPPSDASNSQSAGQDGQSGQPEPKKQSDQSESEGMSASEKQSGQSTEETASEKQSDRSATKDDSASENQSDQSSSKDEKSTSEKQTGQSTSKDETTSEKHSDKSASKEKSTSEKQSGQSTSKDEKSTSEKQSDQSTSKNQSDQSTSEKQSDESASKGKPTAEEQSDETTPQEKSDESATDGASSEKRADESASGSKSAEQSDQPASTEQSGRPAETHSGTQTSEDLWGDEDAHSGLWESRDTEHATSNQDPIDYFEEHELFEVVDYEDVADLVDCVTVLVDDAGERYAVELATPADSEQHSDPVSHFRDERDEFVVEPYDDVESFEECVALLTHDGDVYAVLVDPERGPEREWSALDYFPDYDDYAVVPYVDVERFDEYVTLVVDDAGERYAVLLDDGEDDAPEDV